MHVVMLSDAEMGGGAAICACRLGTGLSDAGVEVTRLVRVASGSGHPWKTKVFGSYSAPGLARRLGQKLGLADEYCYRIEETNRQLDRELAELKPDVVNIHNLHWDQGAGWTPLMAEVCLRHAPTVWTLHDMWSFTGRCAYSWECRKYFSGCDASCPTPTEYPALAPERISGAWQQRREMLARCTNLMAVTPSRWLAGEAKSGLWAGHRIDVIPYGLPLETFKPEDRSAARQALGLEPKGPVLLISANKVSPLLFGALRAVRQEGMTVIMMGRGSVPDLGPLVMRRDFGWLDKDEDKVRVYNAADAYVHASSQDNLPNAIMESIACGTPVIGTPGGGLVDMVRPNVTGWMASAVGIEPLRDAIEQAFADLKSGLDLRTSCRSVAEAEYSHTMQGARYKKLFGALQGSR